VAKSKSARRVTKVINDSQNGKEDQALPVTVTLHPAAFDNRDTLELISLSQEHESTTEFN